MIGNTFKQRQKHDHHVLLQVKQLLQQPNLTGVLQETKIQITENRTRLTPAFIFFSTLLEHDMALFSEDLLFLILSERMRRQERDTTSECALLQKGSLVCIFKQSIRNFSSGTHHAKGSRTDTVKRGRVREEGNDSSAGIAFPLPLCERLQQHGGNRDKHLWGSWYERFWRASVTNKNSNILFFISSLRKLSLSVMWKWKGNNSVNTWKHCCI